MKIHVFSDMPSDQETTRRRTVSENTWKIQHSISVWKTCAVPMGLLPRCFDDGGRTLPFVKDVIDFAVKRSRYGDTIVLTNSDVCVSLNLSVKLDDIFKDFGCCYAFRRDFKTLVLPLSESEIAQGALYSGNDLFAFSREWWEKHGDEMPDMVMGAEAWDMCLRELMIKSSPIPPPILENAIYHEVHNSFWCRPENLNTLPSQIYNRRLALEFIKGKQELEVLLK